MKYDLDQLKALVEGGDKATLDTYLYKAIEKEDVALVQKVNADVRSAIDSEKDVHSNKSLETWKANNLESLVDDEVKKRNPEKTPAEIELEKLKKQFEESEKAREREKLMNNAIKLANDKGLPVDVLDFFIADNEENTTANLTKFEETFNKAVQTQVESKFKDGGRIPEPSNPGGGGSTESIRDMAKSVNIRNF
ncbi:DUF4355 domain-containing protein [Rummeliibacillus pycnus]|uniref:DUF4355 domain-containing protein n=1 Tax=Rummeliibacillus pycnus TaxID=101070 RepID=UPI0037C97757